MATYDEQKLNAELSRDEGRRANVYKDSLGISTVGIGHNLQAGPLPGQKYPMTDAQIDALFAKDVASTVAKLDKALPWWRTLDDVRQRVVINMAFNLGVGTIGGSHGLLGFPNTLSLIKSGNYAAAADAMLKSLWARQVGARATRLSAMMKTGSAATGATPSTPVSPAPAAASVSLLDLILKFILALFGKAPK